MSAADAALQALIDKQAITEVLFSYSRAVDRGDEALLRACYHPDAVEDHGGAFDGPAADYIAAILPALHSDRLMTHSVTNVLVELDGDRARAECYYLSFARYPAAEPPFQTLTLARAIDDFERRDGAWRIARRRLRWEWNHELSIAETWGRGGITADVSVLKRGGKKPHDALYEA